LRGLLEIVEGALLLCSQLSDGRNNPEKQIEEEGILSTKSQTSSWKLPPPAQS